MPRVAAVTVTAGVDVGNATTEVAFLDGDRLLGVDRVPTRGRKGSEDSLRAAAALVRRLERRLGCRVTQARVAPLRAVDTTTMTIPPAPPATGRLRLLTAGVATPGGTGAWAGVPLWLDGPLSPAAGPLAGTLPAGTARRDAPRRTARRDARRRAVRPGRCCRPPGQGLLQAPRCRRVRGWCLVRRHRDARRGRRPRRARLRPRGRATAGAARRRGAGRRGAGRRRRGRADLQQAERGAPGDRSGRPGRRRRL